MSPVWLVRSVWLAGSGGQTGDAGICTRTLVRDHQSLFTGPSRSISEEKIFYGASLLAQTRAQAFGTGPGHETEHARGLVPHPMGEGWEAGFAGRRLIPGEKPWAQH